MASTTMSAHLADPRLRVELTRVVSRRVDASHIEDIVQTTLAEALGAQVSANTELDARRFVFAIARQKIADFYRQRSREQKYAPLEAPPTQPLAGSTDLMLWVDGELPRAPEAKQTFDWMLRESEGETLAEIAAADRVSAPVVRQRVSRLRRHFKERWSKEVAALGLVVIALAVAFGVWRSRPSKIVAEPTPPLPPSAVPVAPLPTPAVSAAPAPIPTPSIKPPPPPKRMAVPKTTASAAEVPSNAPFDRGAAARALNEVDLTKCRAENGPTSEGHATVTFTTTGAVMNAVIDSGPYVGTPVGGCIVAKLRSAHVPAFEGAAVRVGKTFRL